MKVLLLSPKSAKGWPSYCPPIGLCYLKACLLRDGFKEVKVMDLSNLEIEAVREIVHAESPEIVGITSFTETRANALKTAAIIKEIDPQIKLILGGVHATLMYQQIMENYNFVDIISLGESEDTAVELFRALRDGGDLGEVNGIVYRRDGEIVITEQREHIRDLDSVPFPNYDDLDLTIYKEGYDFGRGKPRASIITSRGCLFSCIFCATRPIWGTWRPRSAANVVDEIEWLALEHGFEVFSIADDLFTLDKGRTKEICEGVLKRGLRIRWSAQTRTDCISQEILALMREAGCQVLQFGVESGSPIILKNLNKKEKIEDIINAFSWCKKVGIKTQFNVIVGGPGETRATIEETKNLIRITRPDYLGANCLRIFPGTALWKQAQDEGLCDESFFLTDQECIYYTGAMTVREMFRTLIPLHLLHARMNGFSGFVKLARLCLNALKQTPKKLGLGLFPWR